MKYIFLAVSSFLAIIAQMIAGNNFFLFNFLDLSLLLVVYWTLYRSRTQALFVGSVTGLLLDAALGWPLGYNGFGKTLVAFLIGVASKRFNLEGSLVRALLIFSSSCIGSFSIYSLFLLLQHSVSSLYLRDSLIQAVITTAAGTMLLSIADAYLRTSANRAG